MTGSWGASLWTHFWRKFSKSLIWEVSVAKLNSCQNWSSKPSKNSVNFPTQFQNKNWEQLSAFLVIFQYYWESIGRHHNESWEQEQNVTCRIFATKTGQRLCKPLKISSFSWFLIDFNEFWNKISISFIIEYKQYRFFQYRGHKLTKKYLKIFLTCGLHPTCSRMFYKNPYRKK